MASSDVLVDAFERIRDAVNPAVNDLSAEQLAFRPDGGSNSIGWLVWHLTRIQDDHVAGVADRPQVWLKDGWYERFGLPYPPEAHGFGQTTAEVGQFQDVTAEQLLGYHRAVYAQTLDFLEGLKEEDLGRVVDRSYRPPVTVAVRLVSVVADDLQHLGQAAYVRGLLRG